MSQRDLVLLGGGHTHALALRQLAMRPIPDVRVTLISDQTLTPYSGMLPGFVAGHYTLEQAHIDLNRLCRWAGVTWVQARVTGIDAANRRVQLHGRASFAYDKLSIDTGSTPDLSVPGAAEYAVGVKPVSQFNRIFAHLLAAASQTGAGRWGVVGAGAGGLELVLALAHRLQDKPAIRFHLIHSGSTVLRGYPRRVIGAAERALQRYGVTCHADFAVARVAPEGVYDADGRRVELDQSIWCTGAAAPAWPAGSGIALSRDGFIAVNRFLQSTSHAEVFAAGDVADMLDQPRPKAGVYAVRQAPYLVRNLRRAFAGRALQAVRLQSDFLSLVSLGEKRAVGCRNGLTLAGGPIWMLKNYIDLKFMRRLNDPGPAPAMAAAAKMEMHCAGCGSKLGPELVAGNLATLPVYDRSAVVPALGRAEDASAWSVTPGHLAVQSIDGFRSFSEDLELFGKVCVNHALSDLYACGATPVAAQVWINLAHRHPRLLKRDHRRLMAGIAEALNAQRTTLAGGHSTEGAETHVGIVANGEATEKTMWRKSTPRIGDGLVLSKPLGTGVILAADMQLRAPAQAVAGAFDSMLLSNRAAARALADLHPSAVTDVTGFGLLGHLREMLEPGGFGARIEVAAVPLLPGASELSRAGYRSTLYPQLLPYTLGCQIDEALEPALIDLLIDPQTSGGLLVALPPSQVAAYLAALPGAVLIGQVSACGAPIHLSAEPPNLHSSAEPAELQDQHAAAGLARRQRGSIE